MAINKTIDRPGIIRFKDDFDNTVTLCHQNKKVIYIMGDMIALSINEAKSMVNLLVAAIKESEK